MQLYQKCLSFSTKPPPNSRKNPVYAVTGVSLILLLDHHENFSPCKSPNKGMKDAA